MKRSGFAFVILCLVLTAFPGSGLAMARRDGKHDFDFAFGTFRTHIMTMRRGTSKWVSIDGVVTTRKVWNGKANLEEIEARTPTGQFEGLTLRMYDPQAKQWNLYFANSRDGQIAEPLTGQFANGRGEFYSQELIAGKATFVRNVYFDATPTSYRFEQAFSNDAGKTWQPNFIAALTRVDASKGAIPDTPAREDVQQHSFDWQFGSWKIHMSRLLHPLSDAPTRAELDGSVVVSKIWNGRANLAEIVASGPTSHIEILALRLYLPASHQWTLSFAGSDGGSLSAPMYGAFRNGRGVFYDQETYAGKAVWDQFVFFRMNANFARDEEALSEDGGKTWITTFRTTHTRVR